MVLSPADAASAAWWSGFWEFCEYASEAIVFLGCVGEYIAEYTSWKTEVARHRLGKFSLTILILGLGTGLFSLIKTNALAGLLITSLGEQAEQAGKKAQSATDISTSAVEKAKQADMVSKSALGISKEAQVSASTALTTARTAREEADTFEKRLGEAEHKADEAESHVSEAFNQAIRAQEELDRIKKPRSLNVSALVAGLPGVCKGTEYRFETVFMDEESRKLLDQIENALQLAGWKRIKQGIRDIGIPVVSLFGKKDDLVNMGTGTGIHIVFNSSEPVESLRVLPRDKLPLHVRCAMLLSEGLLNNLSPTQNPLAAEYDPARGTSQVIRVNVGKKP